MPAVHGIIPPLVTPLLADGSLDEAGLINVVDRVIEGGVHGLFVLGTTGEWASLDDRVRRRVIDVCGEATMGRVPSYVHVTETRVNASLALARHAADAGATAIVVAAPYYLPLQQAELLDYVHFLLDHQSLPVVLYNIPQFVKTQYELDTVARLITNPRVLAVKDSSGDLAYQRKLVDLAADHPHFAVLSGNEAHMVEMLQYGTHGCVGGGAHLLPRLLVSLFHAAVAGDVGQTETLHEELRRLSALYDGPTVAASIGNVKTALHQLGVIATDQMCAPYGTASRGRGVRDVLHTVGLLKDGVTKPSNGQYHAAAHDAI